MIHSKNYFVRIRTNQAAVQVRQPNVHTTTGKHLLCNIVFNFWITQNEKSSYCLNIHYF